MPKVVDHEARRAELARAVWRVVRRDGVEGASVRATAREAGWSTGTVQHYFSTQAGMLAFAMEAAIIGSGRRLDLLALHGSADPAEQVAGALEALAPLDGDSRVATELWVAFLSRSLVDENARAIHTRGAEELALECRRLALALLGEDPDDDTVDFEAGRLHALLDGVALAAVAQPDLMPPERVRTILRRHVRQIAEHRPESGR